MKEYRGACHCGAIGYTYRTALLPSDWSIRACQCSFCRAHDALSASDPGGELVFAATRSDCLQRYRFGLRTADFLLCRECGVYIGAVIDTPVGRFGIINTHTLRAPPEDLPVTQPSHYDGEDTAARVDRRTERWTPVRSGP